MSNKGLQRLIATARKAYERAESSGEETAPFGFAGRVAAQWSAIPRGMTGRDLLERLAWWGAGASAAVCLLAFAHQYSRPEPAVFDVFLEADASAMQEF